ncbi:MAG: hypothetical protein K9J85_11585 [Desulfobacteraceae bacterium]|nr:hypothetical protein [Desulfobacteraceae bacterium]
MTVTDAPPEAAAEENPCAAYSETLKHVFSHILAADDAPLAARLFSAAAFAFEVDSLMATDGPGFTEDRLAAEVDRVAERTYERLWMEQFAVQQPDLELPMSMVQSFLLGRIKHFAPEFRERIEAAWSSCVPESADVTERPFLQVERTDGRARVRCTELAVKYRQRRNELYEALGPQVEAHLTDFTAGFMAARSPENYRSLTSMVQDLVLHVMINKFLLACDPVLWDLQPHPQQADDRIKDVIGQTQAALAAQHPAMENLENMVFDQGLQELTHIGLLILF